MSAITSTWLSHIFAAVLGFLGSLLLRLLEPRTKVVWWVHHLFPFVIDEGVTLVTHAITIQNTGRKAANWVEIVHDSRPDFFQLAPPLPFEETSHPDGKHSIRVLSLAPSNFFTVEFLAYKKLPALRLIRSEAGIARPIPVQTQKIFPWWQRGLVWLLLALGVGTIAYTGYRVLWTVFN